MQFTEKGLVAAVGRFREADAWVRWLSPSQGLRTGFAFGGMKSRKRFLGCLDTLNLVLFTAKSARSREGTVLHLMEGTLIHGFQDLKQDRGLTGAAANCLKFAEALQIGPDGAEATWDVLMGTLHCLESGRLEPDIAPVLFRAKLLFEHGYGPVLDRCAGCGREPSGPERMHLVVDKGRIICQSCRGEAAFSGGDAVPLSPGAVRTLEWIRTAKPEEWPNLSIPRAVRRECFEVVDRFIAWHLGLVWDKGRFRKV